MSNPDVPERAADSLVTVTVSWEESGGLYTSAYPAAQFRGEPDRFEVLSPGAPRPGGPGAVRDAGLARKAAALVRSRAFDSGAIAWCETYLDALVLAKVHRAVGQEAHLLWDRTGRGGYAVLTSHPLA